MPTLAVPRRTVRVALVAVAALASSPAAGLAFADPVTVTFTVHPASNDPLNSEPSTGSFTFDSGLVPSGEALLSSETGLGTSVSFSWGGTAFDIGTANVGELQFDGSGHLV